MNKNYFDENGNLVNVENKSLAEIYMDGAKQNRWIPCSERLPEVFEHVLIVYFSYNGKKYITIAYRDDEENACDWCSDWNGDLIDAKVTHWMPLPSTEGLT